ncbi:MAG: hypothetical protein R3B70_15640 [Polyangiaceae bacterium]
MAARLRTWALVLRFLWRVLLVADIGEDACQRESREPSRAGTRRPARSIKAAEAQCLEGDGLSAGVGAADDEDLAGAGVDVAGDDRHAVEEGGAGGGRSAGGRRRLALGDVGKVRWRSRAGAGAAARRSAWAKAAQAASIAGDCSATSREKGAARMARSARSIWASSILKVALVDEGAGLDEDGGAALARRGRCREALVASARMGST